MLMSFFIDPSKFNTRHQLWKILGEFFFEILISTVHYDCSFIMVLNCDMWNSQNFPCGILIENWKINKQKSINIYVGQYIGIGG